MHPPHQLLYANDYLNGVKELETVYRGAEANEIPVMVHTGTSIFPAARNKYGDPIFLDDVAVDFPKLQPAGIISERIPLLSHLHVPQDDPKV